MSARNFSRHAGFTVVEMMIVVLILGILAAIAAPNMGAMIRTQRLKTAAFDVFASLNFARSEAIKRNTTVTVTPKASFWNNGWTVTDSNGTLLRDQSGWDNITSTGPASIVFQSSGRLNAPVIDIALDAYGVQSNAKRCVRLDLSGRATTKEGAC